MSKTSPRLPLPIQLEILNHAYRENALRGGTDYMVKIETVERLSGVSKAWQDFSNVQYLVLALLVFYTQEDPATGRRTRVDTDLLESVLVNHETADFVPQLLRIDVDSGDDVLRYEERDRVYRRQMERAIKVMGGVRQLEFAMLDLDCGSYSELVWRFPLLEKLCLSSRAKPFYVHLSFPPKPSLRSLPPTLVRLDLIGIVIKDWTVSIPSLKILTLDHVKFGPLDSTREETSKTCRDFFASFPTLDAIAFNKLGRLASDALSRLKVYGITQLRLGACAFDCICDHGPTDPVSSSQPYPSFVECLSRHFRCKIQHLILPASPASRLLNELLSSRSGHPHPPYLKKIRSIALNSFPLLDEEPNVNACKTVEFETSFKLLEKAGLREVKLSWAEVEERELTVWEPVG